MKFRRFRRGSASEQTPPRAEDFVHAAAYRVAPLLHTAADRVGPLAVSAADRIGPLTHLASERVTPLAVQVAGRVSPIYATATGYFIPYATQAAERVAPYAANAKQRSAQVAHEAVERIGPRLEDALGRVTPAVDAAREKVSDDLLPRLSDALGAAAAAPVVVEATKRGKATLAAAKGDLALPEPEPERGGGWVKRIAIVAALGGAAAFAVRKLLGSADADWQAARPTAPYSPARADGSSAARATDGTTASDPIVAASAATDAADTSSGYEPIAETTSVGLIEDADDIAPDAPGAVESPGSGTGHLSGGVAPAPGDAADITSEINVEEGVGSPSGLKPSDPITVLADPDLANSESPEAQESRYLGDDNAEGR